MTDLLRGLEEDEAARRLQSLGPNEIAVDGGRNLARIALETLREPMFFLLLGAAVLYLFLGELGEGAFLLGGAIAAIGLVIIQEARSERALVALRQLAQPHARVIRGGIDRQLLARDIVPGDILLVGEGEKLPADGLLVSGEVLSVDESTLTGESAPVTKHPARPGEKPDFSTPGADASSCVFAGTIVVRGQGVVEVSNTGARSALGKIGRSLATIAHEPTPLQKTTGRVVGLLGLASLAFCVVVVITYGLVRHDWVGGALAGITVAIALIPEEYPMVLAVFLALGARRLANHQVLTRRSAVIEALGGVTVLCVDKTGTLTENRMKVASLWTPADEVDAIAEAQLAPAARDLLHTARLASAVRPVDPMDRAIHALAVTSGLAPEGEAPERSWPLRPDLLAVVQSWRQPDGMRLAAAKGAPEAIFRLCRLSPSEQDRLHGVITTSAERGLRMLGVASAKSSDVFADDPLTVKFQFLGLVGFVDPLRSDARAALEEARSAGIKVAMITGDHPATALAIARAAGIDTTAGVLLGSEVAGLPFEALCERLKSVRVFARVIPEQKLRIVEAFKKDGEVVAMTGDGVNDAPALEMAHVGIAMGKKGTDVAREAADLVLLDDSFASIIGGIRMGRRIFSNLRRAMTYITAIHVPVAGIALIPILLGLPPMLFPMHVVLLELIIDPTCSLVFEAEPSERAAMKRPPRRKDETLFGLTQLAVALAQGVGVLAGVLGVYWWALSQFSEAEARAIAFIVLVTGNLALALTDSASSARIFTPQRGIYWAIALAVLVVMTMVLAIPALASIFAFALPNPLSIGIGILVGGLSGVWTAALTLLLRLTRGRTEHFPVETS